MRAPGAEYPGGGRSAVADIGAVFAHVEGRQSGIERLAYPVVVGTDPLPVEDLLFRQLVRPDLLGQRHRLHQQMQQVAVERVGQQVLLHGLLVEVARGGHLGADVASLDVAVEDLEDLAGQPLAVSGPRPVEDLQHRPVGGRLERLPGEEVAEQLTGRLLPAGDPGETQDPSAEHVELLLGARLAEFEDALVQRLGLPPHPEVLVGDPRRPRQKDSPIALVDLLGQRLQALHARLDVAGTVGEVDERIEGLLGGREGSQDPPLERIRGRWITEFVGLQPDQLAPILEVLFGDLGSEQRMERLHGLVRTTDIAVPVGQRPEHGISMSSLRKVLTQ